MQSMTCCSRAVSLPSGPLSGKGEWQIGQISSSRKRGRGRDGGVSMSNIERTAGRPLLLVEAFWRWCREVPVAMGM